MASGRVNLSANADIESLSPADISVFAVFELLGFLGFWGNLLLLFIIIRFNYLTKPSFVLIASLAIADIIHSLITTSYFYPPIILKRNHLPFAVYRSFNSVDWIAWGITLSHMAGICIDRLIAIVLFQQYTQIVTVRRVLVITLTLWIGFTILNILLTSLDFCCPVVPKPEFYTFGYEFPKRNASYFLHITTISPEMSNDDEEDEDIFNIYKHIYMPIEIATMLILAVSNPTILFRLYQRYKMRQRTSLRNVSNLLRRMTAASCAVAVDPSNVTSHRASSYATFAPPPPTGFLNRDVKIFLQIIIVTVIFFAYMFNYYLFFYIIDISISKWASMLNSLFYSITHMVNPLVYFSLNEQMQEHLRLQMSSVCARLKAVNRNRTTPSESQRTTLTRPNHLVIANTPLFGGGLDEFDQSSIIDDAEDDESTSEDPAASREQLCPKEQAGPPNDQVLCLRLTSSKSGLRATVETDFYFLGDLLYGESQSETFL